MYSRASGRLPGRKARHFHKVRRETLLVYRNYSDLTPLLMTESTELLQVGVRWFEDQVGQELNMYKE